MFCPSCGSELKVDGEKDVLYCPYCGSELPDMRVSINRNYNTNNSYERKDINITKTNKEIDWTGIILVGMLFVITLAIIIAALVNG